jgi:hypothetical protein
MTDTESAHSMATTGASQPAQTSVESVVDRAARSKGVASPEAKAAGTVQQDRFEPNDGLANATLIGSGTYTDLEISTPNDIDVFAVELESGDALSAAIDFSHFTGDLDLLLLGPDGTLRQISDSETDGEEISYVAGQSGTYYLVVVGFQGATNGYDLRVEIPNGQPDPSPGEREPNDDFDEATPIQPGTISDLQISEGDIDVYAIQLNRSEVLSASINFTNAQGDLDLFLFNPNQTVRAFSATTNDTETVTTVADETGTYYLVVAGYQGATNSYNLTTTVTTGSPPPAPDDPNEPNDGFANATSIQPGEYSGLSITTGDIDFYAVNLSVGDVVEAEINFSQAEGDLDLLFVDPNGNIAAFSVTATDNENVSSIAAESGTYYLVVLGFGNASASYNLSLNVSGISGIPPIDRNGTDGNVSDGNGTDGNVSDGNGSVPPMRPGPSGDGEPNDDLANATVVGPGTYGGLAITENDFDIYAVNLSAGDALTASINFSQAVGDLDLFLFGSDLIIRQAGISASDNESVSYVAPESGTYYLLVVGYQNATAPYELSISVAGQNESRYDDPPSDVIGWEMGYWADEPLSIDTTDGLSPDERQALLARGMARVEEIRQREFQRPVNFTVISREEYAQLVGSNPFDRLISTPYYNQVYEATFIVDEQTNAYDEVVGETSVSVGGFYVPGSNEFVLITEDPDSPTVDEGILIHELVHALQDQIGALDAFPTMASADRQAGFRGLIEGEANYIQYRYEQRCENAEWSCVPSPASTGGGSSDINLGIAVTGFQPYSDGPALIADLLDRGGWDAVEAAYTNPPVSTEQTIHPERYPSEQPSGIEYAPTSSSEWLRFDTETIGEAWIYSMFWYQDREYEIPVVDDNSLFAPEEGVYDTFNYTSVPSDGWGDDRLFLFTNGTDFGYVWVTEWDSEADARQFFDAYVQTVEGHGGQSVGPSTWRIPEGLPFADAFRIVRDGDTVIIANAPTVEALSGTALDTSTANVSVAG